MDVEVGGTYTFRYRTGRTERGTVLDILTHPNSDPVWKVKFEESGPSQIRLVRASRLASVNNDPLPQTAVEDAELEVASPSRLRRLKTWLRLP